MTRKFLKEKKEYDKAFKYYIQAANLKESWASNKVGNFYRLGLRSI